MPWLVPTTSTFSSESCLVFLIQDVERFKHGRILGDDGSLAEDVLELAQAMLMSEVGTVRHELLSGNAREGVGEYGVDIAANVVKMFDLPVADVGG